MVDWISSENIEEIIIALLKGEVGQVGQLSQGDMLAVSQRIVAA